MKTSASISKLLPDLFKVKQAITPLKKEAENPYFSSSYVDLNGVLAGVEPLLEVNNFMLLQPVSGRVVETILLHVSGEFISSEMELILSKNDMQALGSAVSYARRYSLMSLLGLKAIDDDGNSATFEKAPPMRAPAKAMAKTASSVPTKTETTAAAVATAKVVTAPKAVATPPAAAVRKPFNKPGAAAKPTVAAPVSNGVDSAAEFD